MSRNRTLGRFGRTCVAAALFATALLVAAAPSQAKSPLSTTVTVPDAVKRVCIAGNVSGKRGVASRAVTAPVMGLVSVRLEAARGDWDLGVFDATRGYKVAGSANFAATELAEGMVQKGQSLVVQACRLQGSAGSARMTIDFEQLVPSKYPVQVVRVSTPTRTAKNKLNSLGLDVTEHAGPDYIDVVIHSPAQAAKLGQAGFISRLVVRDLVARQRAEDAEMSGKVVRSVASSRTCTTPTPGPRAPGTCYRTLDEFNAELKALADNNSTFVRRFTLPLQSHEGRSVEGIEIATNVNARDGRPVFFMMGVHHAREWPSGEHTLEWAYELVCAKNPSYDPPDPPGGVLPGCAAAPAATRTRAANLVDTTRTLIVPVVNVDGFNMSRTAGEGFGHGAGHDAVLTSDELLAFPNEYRRKNCRVSAPVGPDPNAGTCAGPAFGLGSTGVDPNRNYGTFWGGPGSSTDPTSETFHGPHCANETTGPVKGTGCGPFSEPETENVRRVVSGTARDRTNNRVINAGHVTTLVTNHTFTGLVLRAPGLATQGLAPDENPMKALGDAMASKNGYTSQYGWQLYDTTGTTEDWSYNSTGGYGYTFEIGKNMFHPSYAENVANYDGSNNALTGFTMNGGNREAYFLAHEAALSCTVCTANGQPVSQTNPAQPLQHSILSGTAPVGAVLRLAKSFETPTSIRNATTGAPQTFTDALDHTIQVTSGGAQTAIGSYTWHINPSTRPLVMSDRGAINPGTPSPNPPAFSGAVVGGPPPPTPQDPGAAPCANFTSPPATCTNVHPFNVPNNPGNYTVAVSIRWTEPGSDWDMKVYKDRNGNGLVDGPDGAPVATSGQSTTAFEATSFLVPLANNGPGDYLVQVINYAAADPYNGEIKFFQAEPFQPGCLTNPAGCETWTLTCEIPEGTVKSTQQVLIFRGQQLTITPGCGSPTSVQVSRFAAHRGKRGVTLAWRTRNEQAIAGFNLYRGSARLNRALIRSKVSGKAAGTSYRFIDRTARQGVYYTYRLQVVGIDGKRTWRGTAAARIAQ